MWGQYCSYLCRIFKIICSNENVVPRTSVGKNDVFDRLFARKPNITRKLNIKGGKFSRKFRANLGNLHHMG